MTKNISWTETSYTVVWVESGLVLDERLKGSLRSQTLKVESLVFLPSTKSFVERVFVCLFF